MKQQFSSKIVQLATLLNKPLYAVGGYVRDFLIDGTLSVDVDLSGAIPVSEIVLQSNNVGIQVVAEYKRTGTVVLFDGEQKYEYTAFRREVYPSGGAHTPSYTELTEDIKIDALRRDFKCNAVYCNVLTGDLVDPLGGVKDIKNKVLDTVTDAGEVFSHDGLRLMRLARFAGELGFSPTNKVLKAAKEHAINIKDISAERIYDELKKILVSDTKYCFSDKRGHYTGLRILSDTGVLDYIMPELTLGRGMAQRADYHNYDVLEHSLRTVLYADRSIRFDALLHDIGKPFCMEKYGKYHNHPYDGKAIAQEVLKRLKVDKQTADRVCFMVEFHMLDLKSEMRESKLRRFIVKNYKYIPALLNLKQADYSACKDDVSKAPSVIRWERLIETMRLDGTPFSMSDLKISTKELQDIGYSGKALGNIMEKLFDVAVINPLFNNNNTLKNMAINAVNK